MAHIMVSVVQIQGSNTQYKYDVTAQNLQNKGQGIIEITTGIGTDLVKQISQT